MAHWPSIFVTLLITYLDWFLIYLVCSVLELKHQNNWGSMGNIMNILTLLVYAPIYLLANPCAQMLHTDTMQAPKFLSTNPNRHTIKMIPTISAISTNMIIIHETSNSPTWIVKCLFWNLCRVQRQVQNASFNLCLQGFATSSTFSSYYCCCIDVHVITYVMD